MKYFDKYRTDAGEMIFENDLCFYGATDEYNITDELDMIDTLTQSFYFAIYNYFEALEKEHI